LTTPPTPPTPPAPPTPPRPSPPVPMGPQLAIQFHGYVLIRLPTDPDPPDEPRGVSGYTFAFAGEPDLDRVIRLQPPSDFTLRTYSPPVGVTVFAANRVDGGSLTPVPALMNGAVNLLGKPRLENRNWTLTLPGFEPIVPFDLAIAGSGVGLGRSAPFDPANPDQPIWLIPEPELLTHGAQGMEFEPETIGRATGVWDGLGMVTQRLARLRADLQKETDPTKKVALQGRIAELEIGVANPADRRVFARNFVERFSFTMTGLDAAITGDPSLLGGAVDTTAAWTVSFWMGAWDPDTLTAFMEGSLQVPYARPTA
jgi:hypothetical protein